jgi:hypothetical protein
MLALYVLDPSRVGKAPEILCEKGLNLSAAPEDFPALLPRLRDKLKTELKENGAEFLYYEKLASHENNLLKKWYYKKFNKIALYEKLITTSGSDDYRLSSNIMKKTLSNILWENLCFRKYLQINRRIWKILINLRGKEQPSQINHNLKYF